MRFKKGLLLNPSLKAPAQRFSYSSIFHMISAYVGLFPSLRVILPKSTLSKQSLQKQPKIKDCSKTPFSV